MMRPASEYYFDIRYSFTSGMGDGAEEHYINFINGVLLVKDSDDNVLEEAGKVTLRLVDVDLANHEGYSLEKLFKQEHNLYEIGRHIYSYEDRFFNQQVCEAFGFAIKAPNVLIVDRLEVKPRYRGRNWGYKVMKDVKDRCSAGCGLIVLRVMPLQHETMNILSDDERAWQNKMRLDSLEKDQEKAFYKLAGYYAGMGFRNIGGPDIFALNPSVQNPLDNEKVDFRMPQH